MAKAYPALVGTFALHNN